MRVSVVIPIFNEEKYLEKCLESLENQEQKADEIIIVDNNCTDKSIDIAKKYKVRIIKENKQGMICARNTGFNSTSYEVIARCDADVILPPSWIRTIKNNFKDHSVQALTGGFNFYDLGFNIQSLINIYLKIVKFLIGGEILLGPNMVIRKELWQELKDKVCLDDKKVHEDIDLSLHIIKKGIKIRRDQSLSVDVSARRIKHNPLSFFIEYPVRLVKTILMHR